MKLNAILTVSGGLGVALLLRAWAKAKDETDRATLRKLAQEAGAAQISRDIASKIARNRELPHDSLPSFIQPSQPAQPAPPAAPRQIQDSTLAPVAGRMYRVVVNVNFPASLAAGVSDVKSQAEKNGFQNVVVSKTMPAGWPGGVTGDYYVTAIYAGGPVDMARSYLGGEVVIKDVWEG